LARWIAHQLVLWGLCTHFVTFQPVFGSLHFEPVGQDGCQYRAYVADWGTVSFDARSVAGWIALHLLDIAAPLVLLGVFVFLARRLRDPGELAVERSNDFLALAGLFVVSVGMTFNAIA
jgi:hypothetical protein